MQTINAVSLIVRDYDEAIAYFTQMLGWALVEDTPQPMEPGKRWVRVAPQSTGISVLLMKAKTPEQIARIGDQTGGRVAFILHTDDFLRDHRHYLARVVAFIETPRQEDYGLVAVFKDLYGNLWDLLQLGN